MILIVISLFMFFKSSNNNEEYFNYNNISISEADYKAIQEQFKDSPQVRICNMETKNCIVLHKYT